MVYVSRSWKALLLGGIVSCGVLLTSLIAVPADTPTEWNSKNIPGLVELYKQLHATPELSFQEDQTAERLATELKKTGAEVTTGVGRKGVVAILKNGPGPTVMVRTDLDGLPVIETTGLPYASKVVVKDQKGSETGVMHACGHDIHITSLIGVARYLADNKSAWQGTVMFIGQPAEEIVSGAAAMLKDGLFTRFPKPDYGLALHVDPQMATGKIGYRMGYALANVDSIDITMRGKGGHGAYPQNTVDPIVQAAHLVVDLQSIISRERSPFEPAVITVGSIHGGTKHNIIGETCHLQLTVRSYTEKVRTHLHDAIRRKALAAASSAGAPEPIIKFSDATPAMKNDERLVERMLPVFRRVLGDDNVILVEPSMGAEDFSEYGVAGVPIFMYGLGSISQKRIDEAAQTQKRLPSLHSPSYYPDPEPTIAAGVLTMSSAVMELLPVKGQKK